MSKDDDSKARSPLEWREMLKTGYDYPEETQRGRRGARRRARKQYRQRERTELRQVLEEERRREPMTAGGAVLVLVVILVIGWASARWFLHQDEQATESTTVADAPAEPELAEPHGAPGMTTAQPSAEPSATVDLSSPEKAAEGFARAYLTMNPPVDKSHETVIRRAAPWMTDALVRNLVMNSDRAWNELISNGGISRITSLTVKNAEQGMPVDTPLRAWRTVTVEAAIDGYKQYKQTYVLQTEATRSSDNTWRVARVLGV
ncbi:hypothetical protein [Streptomyces olivoreticuli]|uniref:hypothetical protein n=1 Tax=Streptomyces olivoreticuli TaxID=68246 RepID=UPI000E2616C6|nr:hypothetical protein [Streptomyces olivoreticuli]